MLVLPLTADHPRILLLQEAQAFAGPLLNDPAYCEAIAAAGPAYTAFHLGEPVLCAGLVERHPNVAEAWALLARDAGSHMVSLTRHVRRFFDACGYRRIETAVASNHAAGHRWALLLGMEAEGTMRAYLPDGSDAVRYARVNPCG